MANRPTDRSNNNIPENERSNPPVDPWIDAFQTYYERIHLEGRKPLQSRFVSSTTWTNGDSRCYRTQTSHDFGGGEHVQDQTISSSGSTDNE